MNILLTSIGRRSYLVRYFRQAVQGRGKVFTTNSHPNSAAMHEADFAEVVPPSYAENYLNTIIDLCKCNDIKLLCSCHDLDVFALAKGRDKLSAAGVTVFLPGSDWAMTWLDKYECGTELAASGFDVPWSSISIEQTKSALGSGKAAFPLVIKARLGFGSIGLSRCRNIGELETMVGHAREQIAETSVNGFLNIPAESSILVEEELGGPEYCIDLVNDLAGSYAGHFVCEVHGMRAGESDSATTLDPEVLGDLPFRLSALTRHVGIWGIDLMMDQGQPKIVDINPRFTGDYPFHHLAGANVPAVLCAWAEGKAPDPQWFSSEVGVHGYKDLVPRRIPFAVEHSTAPGSVDT